MADSEIVVFILCLGTAIVFWGIWLRDAIGPTMLRKKTNYGTHVFLAVVAASVMLFLVLKNWSSHDVMTSTAYLAFYEIMGLAWLSVVVRAAAWLGIIFRDDVVERHNPAAAISLGGAIGGLGFCFAGGNIGDGPGWWVVIFSAGLATLGFFLVWLATEIGAQASEAITVERDRAAGVRLGALLIAVGLVLGRSVAGDWQSAEDTFREFASMGYPLVLLPVAETVISRTIRSSPGRIVTAISVEGVVPAIAYLGAAIFYVVSQGWWR